MKDHAGQGVFISDGGGDIGRALAARFVAAGAFVFLAGDDGAYITGTTLLIDGGASLVRRD
jgi:NAD(P)-dependent dehydrogenase (short-subunit alcohol dehydrogenase family)